MQIVLQPEARTEMEELDCIFSGDDIKQRSIFIINDRIQVVLITNLVTGKKLDEDEHVNAYLQAATQANLLTPYGISDPIQITSITRSGGIDLNNQTSIVISLEVFTNTDGFDELRCSILDEGFLSESEDHLILEDSSEDHFIPEDSYSWNQQVPGLIQADLESNDSPEPCAETIQGPILRWNSKMTTQLINIRGEMDREFTQAKFKFHLWEQVAVKLNEILSNVRVTAKDCDDKWRNIVATYRKNIDRIRCCGDNQIRWEYFTAMDNILKGTKELQIITEVPQNSDESLTELMHSFDSADEILPIIEEIKTEELEDVLKDCIITRKLNGETRRWTTEQCLQLLYLRREADSKFNKSNDMASNQWRELASQMNVSFLSDFTATELESVWNHCNINYEVGLEILKLKGTDAISWKYFAVMDELRGGTPETAELCGSRPGECWLEEFHKLKNPSLTPRSDIVTFNAKYETDSEDTSSFSSSSCLWSQEMIMKLISLKKAIEHDISRHKISRRKQWLILVRRFRTMKNVRVTERACEMKWRNLVRTYKNTLHQVNRRGTSAIRWQYFWRMHEILGSSLDIESLPGLANRNSPETEVIPSNNVPTLPSTEQITVESQDETTVYDLFKSSQADDSSITINDLRNANNQTLHEIIEKQSKDIEELHREQLNIKTLLLQLLQKFQ